MILQSTQLKRWVKMSPIEQLEKLSNKLGYKVELLEEENYRDFAKVHHIEDSVGVCMFETIPRLERISPMIPKRIVVAKRESSSSGYDRTLFALLHEVGHAIHNYSRKFWGSREKDAKLIEDIADDIASYVAIRLGTYFYAIATDRKVINIERQWKVFIDENIKSEIPWWKNVLAIIFYKSIMVKVKIVEDGCYSN